MNPSNQLNALARFQVDIPSTLDAEWATDVKKASLQIPPRVKKQLRRFLQDPIRRSKRVYRYRGKLDVANKYWKVCEDQNTDTITYQLDTENSRLRNLLERCEPDARRMLITYQRDLARGLPINHIYEKMSASPADIDQRNVELKELEEFLCTLKGSTHE